MDVSFNSTFSCNALSRDLFAECSHETADHDCSDKPENDDYVEIDTLSLVEVASQKKTLVSIGNDNKFKFFITMTTINVFSVTVENNFRLSSQWM